MAENKYNSVLQEHNVQQGMQMLSSQALFDEGSKKINIILKRTYIVWTQKNGYLIQRKMMRKKLITHEIRNK